MAGVSDKQLVTVGPWPRGINNIAKEDKLPTDENGNVLALRDAVNVDLDSQGNPSRRPGRERFFPGALTHSLWSAPGLDFGLFVDAGVLHALFADESVESLGVGVSDLPLSYELINDRIYYTNRSTCGMVSLGLQRWDWAPGHPGGQPAVTATDGYSLTAGQYQVAVTFVDVLGRESGSTAAAKVDVADLGGIALAQIPQPSNPLETPTINVYCTGPNDQVLRLAATVPAGTTTGLIGSVANGRTLTTQFLRPLPAGQIVRAVNGRQFVAVGNEILYSAELRYGLHNPVKHRIRFTGEVTLMEPAGNGGMFVAVCSRDGKHKGTRTYWLNGVDPANYEQRIARSGGAVKYSATRVPGDVLGLETAEDLPVWIATTGHFCVGTPGGAVVVLKRGEAVIDDADRAAMLFREQNGIQQIIAALRGTRPQGLAITDKVVAHVLYDGSND